MFTVSQPRSLVSGGNILDEVRIYSQEAVSHCSKCVVEKYRTQGAGHHFYSAIVFVSTTEENGHEIILKK